VTVDGLLDPASTPVQRVTGQTDDVEGIDDRDRLREFFGGGGQVNDHGDVLVAAAGVALHVLARAGDANAVEPSDIVDQDALALGQDCVVRG